MVRKASLQQLTFKRLYGLALQQLSLVACFHSPDEVAIFVSKTKENSVEFPAQRIVWAQK